jgi:L-ascorbate metabolism protein UlaG (beta-lactamase superfamily)
VSPLGRSARLVALALVAAVGPGCQGPGAPKMGAPPHHLERGFRNFAGDTGYHAPIFREIGRRLGPFDLGAIPIGSYMPRAVMLFSHLTPEEALEVQTDVAARRLLAIHWGTFDLAQEPLDEPPRRLETERRRRGVDPDRVWVLRHGETRSW